MLATRTLPLAAAVCTLGLALAAPASAHPGPHSCDPPHPALMSIGQLDHCDHTDGLHVDADALDLLCLHVEALDRDELADARARIPCARWDGFRDCAQARNAGVHDIPKGDPRYRGYLDEDRNGVACDTSGDDEQFTPGALPVWLAPAPRTVHHDLPVTH